MGIFNKLKISHFLILTFILKILLAYLFPVFGDEAYYYIWSKHLQLSYFDHPPMVSWLIYLGHLLFPEGSNLALRFPFILLSFLTSLIWLKILKDLNVDRINLLWFFIFVFLNPLLGLGSIVATPDAALVFFWSLSYFFFQRILKQKRDLDYLGLGVSLGLGFCSKYHIVLFVISGLIYLVFSGNFRKIRALGVALTVLSGGFFSLPVIIWNAQNNWASFLFQIDHGFGEDSFSWQWPVGYVIAQSLIINPFIVTSLIRKSAQLMDFTFSASQLLFFLSSSFKSVVEGNWPITSHFHSIYVAISDSKFNRKAGFFYWSIFYIILGGFFLSPASEKVRKNLVNSAQLEDIYPLVKEFSPLYGASYQVASLLTWKTQVLVPKLNELSRHDFYDSLPESLPTATEFYVLKNDYSTWPEKYDKYTKTKLRHFDNTGLELYHFKYD